MSPLATTSHPHGNVTIAARSAAIKKQAADAVERRNARDADDWLKFERDGVYYDAEVLARLSRDELVDTAYTLDVPLVKQEPGEQSVIADVTEVDIISAILEQRGVCLAFDRHEAASHDDGQTHGTGAFDGDADVRSAVVEPPQSALDKFLKGCTVKELKSISRKRGIMVTAPNKQAFVERLQRLATTGISRLPALEERAMVAEGWRLNIPYGGSRLKFDELKDRLRCLESPLTVAEAKRLLSNAL